MTPAGDSFNDFPEIVPTREIKTKIEKTSFSRPRPWAYFWNGPLCCSINIAPTLIRQ